MHRHYLFPNSDAILTSYQLSLTGQRQNRPGKF